MSLSSMSLAQSKFFRFVMFYSVPKITAHRSLSDLLHELWSIVSSLPTARYVFLPFFGAEVQHFHGSSIIFESS